MPRAPKPKCFIISPIGPTDSDIRKRSDKVLKHIFRKALSKKYDVIRGDEIDEPGMITSQVLRAVQEAPLVIADLTGHNPNVLYELSVRHAIEKPIIHVIEPKVSKIPFDIAGFRAIEFDLTDPDSVESAVEQLKKHAEQAAKGQWGETPVKLANIMRRSKEDSQETLLLKEAVQGISRLQSSIAELISFTGQSARLSSSLLPPIDYGLSGFSGVRTTTAQFLSNEDFQKALKVYEAREAARKEATRADLEKAVANSLDATSAKMQGVGKRVAKALEVASTTARALSKDKAESEKSK